MTNKVKRTIKIYISLPLNLLATYTYYANSKDRRSKAEMDTVEDGRTTVYSTPYCTQITRVYWSAVQYSIYCIIYRYSIYRYKGT